MKNQASAATQAVVIGGSLGGLFAGLLLRSIGWDVDIYERSPQDLDSRGGGIVLQPEVLEAFHRAGVQYDTSIEGCLREIELIQRGVKQISAGCGPAPISCLQDCGRRRLSSVWSRRRQCRHFLARPAHPPGGTPRKCSPTMARRGNLTDEETGASAPEPSDRTN